MLNTRTINYRIRFLEDIAFMEEPEIAFIKAIYKRLKNILCINQEGKCSSCTHNSKCLYDYMAAGDFQLIDNVPVKIDKPLLSRRTMKAEDILNLKFTFLGDATTHIDFLNYTLKEFEARGLFKEGYRFLIESRTDNIVRITADDSIVSGIEVLTPIDSMENIFEIEKEKIDNLNKLYNITENSIDSITESYEFDAIRFKVKNPLYIGAYKVIQNGYVGTIKFKKPIYNNNLLEMMKVIGAGKFYAIGGGCIEFCKI